MVPNGDVSMKPGLPIHFGDCVKRGTPPPSETMLNVLEIVGNDKEQTEQNKLMADYKDPTGLQLCDAAQL